MSETKYLLRAEVITEGDMSDLEQFFGITDGEAAGELLKATITNALFGAEGPREGESVTVELLGTK